MGYLATLGDSLRNLVANIGTTRDKAASSYYDIPQLRDDEATNAYRGTWLARKIVDIPAKDACRRWRGWNADKDQTSKLEAEEKRLGVQAKVLDAMRKGRLYGGAAIYIGTGDPDPSKELNPERIAAAGIRHLNVITKRILQAGEIETDPESPLYGKPKVYTISGQSRGQVDIHPSRLVLFTGHAHPDPEMATGATPGWGDSILLSVLDTLKNADATIANIASLVFEAKIDVIRIPGFMAGLASDSEYATQVLNRLSLAATAKGVNGTLLLDKEEEYDSKTMTFAQLPEILQKFLEIVSGAADIPVTRLLGTSPGGLNSTGESDLRNYYDHIQSLQELEVQTAMGVLDECMVRSALGSRPPELFYNWRSLWQPTAKERADIGKITAETIKAIDDTGLLPDQVMGKVAVNMLTEAGIAPGLESEMGDWLAENPEGFEREDDEAAAVTPAAKKGEPDELKDATPRSVYVRRDVVNKAEIVAWAKSQGIPVDVADELHVTIAYSRQAFDWIKAGNAREWGDTGKDELIIPEGGPRAVEPLGGMSAVILFASHQLHWRHEEILRAGGSSDYPDYQPHISLTKSPVDLLKVEPYRGRIVLGPEIFEDLRED